MAAMEKSMLENELSNILGLEAFVLRSQTDKVTTVGPLVDHCQYLEQINKPDYVREEFLRRVHLVGYIDCQSSRSTEKISIKVPTGRYTNGPYHLLITEVGEGAKKSFYQFPDELGKEYWRNVGILLDVFHQQEPDSVFIAGTNYSPLELGRHATQSLKKMHTHVYMFDQVDGAEIQRQGRQLSKQERRVVTDPFREISLDLTNEIVFDQEFKDKEDISYFSLPKPRSNPEGLEFPKGYFFHLPQGLEEFSGSNLSRLWSMIKKVSLRIDQQYYEFVDCFVINQAEANKDPKARYQLRSLSEIQRGLHGFFNNNTQLSEKTKNQLMTLATFLKNPETVLAQALDEKERLLLSNTRLFLKGPGYVFNLYRGITRPDKVFLCLTPRYLSGGGNPEAFGILPQKELGVVSSEQRRRNKAVQRRVWLEVLRRNKKLHRGDLMTQEEYEAYLAKLEAETCGRVLKV